MTAASISALTPPAPGAIWIIYPSNSSTPWRTRKSLRTTCPARFVTTTAGAGGHWRPISPDLTRNDKTKQQSSGGPIWLDLSGAETVGAILSFSISPVDPKTIWTGTDDGVVQVTHDGGQHWDNVTAAMANLPQWGRIQQIDASPSDVNSAYVAVDFHEVQNNKPYVFKTHDGGKTSTSIIQGLPQDYPARVTP